jgi:hypothetical protein
VAQAKANNPNVPIYAVINPASGPGTWQDPNFVNGISTLQSAGVVVLGYVWTNYGSRSLSSVESDILAYHSLYGISGVYIDQMANWAGLEWYYSDLTSYAHSLGMWFVAGNPGADVPSSYIGTVDTIVIYENSGEPSLSFLGGWHAGYSKGDFGIVAYNVGWLDQSYVESAESYLGYIYLTNGVWPNPYSPVSSYLSSLAATIEASATGGGYSPPAAPSSAGGGSIGVVTVGTGGDELYGLYTILWENGAAVSSCFSPCTFSVSGGQTYQVSVSNWGPYYFASWGDGVQSNSYTVSEPSAPTSITLWAIYS